MKRNELGFVEEPVRYFDRNYDLNINMMKEIVIRGDIDIKNNVDLC